MTPRIRSLIACAALVALTAVAGCKDKGSAPADKGAPAAPAGGELHVFAAASLREAFTDLGKRFEAGHAGTSVSFHFAGSQELRAQIEHGAVVDVFASADTKHMDSLVGAGAMQAPVVFAHNEPVAVVAREQATKIATFADLPSAPRIVVGAPEVPIGRYTVQILERVEKKQGPELRRAIEAKIVSRELNVRQVLAKVSLGEADAAIVYRTDAIAAADKVSVVEIPPDVNVIADYPIAVAKAAPHATLATAWVELVTSADGQEILRRHGFQPGTPAGGAPPPR